MMCRLTTGAIGTRFQTKQTLATTICEHAEAVQLKIEPVPPKNVSLGNSVDYGKGLGCRTGFEAACNCHNGDECHKVINQMFLLTICYHSVWSLSLVIILRVGLRYE
jgi:hypothetical protein